MKGRDRQFNLLYLLIIVLFYPVFAWSQSYWVHTYTEKDGLSNSSVYDLKQDKTGRMWFTTRSGISMYDGFEWKCYAVQDGLPAISYFGLSIDETGRVWAISQAPSKTISSFVNGKWVPMDTPQYELSGAVLTSFQVTTAWGETNIAIGTSQHGLYLFKNGSWQCLNEEQGFISNRINSIVFIDSKFYIGTNKGIAIISKEGIDLEIDDRIAFPDSNIVGLAYEKIMDEADCNTKIWVMGQSWLGYILNGNFYLLIQKIKLEYPEPYHYVMLVPDGIGGVFFGYQLNLFHYHQKTASIEHLGRESGIIAEGTTSILIDREQNLWIANVRGVSKIATFRFSNYYQKHGMLDNEVTAIIESRPNNYIMGHPYGISIYDGTRFKTIEFQQGKHISLTQARVLDLCKDSAGNHWAACTEYGLARIDNNGKINWLKPDTFENMSINSILEDEHKRLWVLTNGAVFQKSDSGFTEIILSGLPKSFYRKIFKGVSGSIYIATSTYGVYHFNGNVWKKISGDAGTGVNNVYSILEDSNGKLWVGTIAGLCEVKGDSLVKYSKNGFNITRPVYLILEDSKNRMWFGTDNGAIRWDGEISEEYTVNNGFAVQETNRSAGLVDSYGRVWIGGDLGISCYREEFDKDQTKISPPYVELIDMEIDGKGYSLSNRTKLSHDQNNLVFRFRGISLIDEHRNRFRVWLEGFDENWSDVSRSANMEIRYTNLPPGNYKFHLRAMNAIGQWSESVSSDQIIINKPFWRTGWFQLVLILILGSLVYVIIKINSDYRYSTELKIQVRERTAKLQESEHRLKRYNEVLLNLSTNKAITEGDLDEMFKKITEITSKTNSVERVGIWLYNESMANIRCMDLYELKVDKHSSGFKIPASDYPIYFQKLKSHRTIAAKDAQTDPRTIEFAESYLKPLGITSMLDTQIRIGGNGVGVICQEHIGEQRTWSFEEINFGNSMADFVALTIEANNRKKVKEELEVAKELAEAANKSKSLFLANMSHEIRTPMNGIIGLTDILLETRLSDQQFQYLSMVKSSSAQLLVVLNDILDFSKIEAGQLGLEMSNFNLREEVESISDTVIHRLNEKNLELGILVQSDVPVYLVGDAGRLKQILLNLVGNAIKFTDEGEIIVHVSLDNESKNEADIRFRVKDTGIGIIEDKQRMIFDCFTQAEDSTTRKYGGTGLGLAISSQLVKMMSGNIWVNSRPGKGSEFLFTARFAKQEESKKEAMILSNGFRDIKICAVDDNATNRLILKEMLKSFGCKFKIVDSGEKLLQLLEHEKDCKVVITDFQMPEMDGKELVTKVMEIERFSKIPIIILTSIGQNKEINGLAELENILAISKPIRQSQLFNAIMTALKISCTSKPGLKNGSIKMDRINQILEKIAALKIQQKILLVEDNLVNQAVASSILEITGLSIEIASDGQKAIDALQEKEYALILMDVKMPVMDGLTATKVIRNSLKLEDIPIIAMTAHAMKGDKEKCLEVGMDDYISKPIIPEDLYRVIYQWLSKIKIKVKQKVIIT